MLCMVPRSRNGKYTNDMRKRDQERRKKDFGALPGTEGNLEMYCFSLPHTGDIHNSGYIKFSTLSVLSVFGAPICPHVNSCLFLFCCLNDCRSVFHVEKKNMVKTLSAGYPSLIQSQLHSGG